RAASNSEAVSPPRKAIAPISKNMGIADSVQLDANSCGAFARVRKAVSGPRRMPMPTSETKPSDTAMGTRITSRASMTPTAVNARVIELIKGALKRKTVGVALVPAAPRRGEARIAEHVADRDQRGDRASDNQKPTGRPDGNFEEGGIGHLTPLRLVPGLLRSLPGEKAEINPTERRAERVQGAPGARRKLLCEQLDDDVGARRVDMRQWQERNCDHVPGRYQLQRADHRAVEQQLAENVGS